MRGLIVGLVILGLLTLGLVSEVRDTSAIAAADNHADLGDSADEAFHSLSGWGSMQGPPANPFVAPSGDRTKRYQSLRGVNSLNLFVSYPGISYTLVTEVEDGSCTDNFELYVNGQGPLYSYVGRHLGNRAVVHRVSLAAGVITAQQVAVTFKNTATDACGLAAVYNVSLEPTAFGLPWSTGGVDWTYTNSLGHGGPGRGAMDFAPPASSIGHPTCDNWQWNEVTKKYDIYHDTGNSDTDPAHAVRPIASGKVHAVGGYSVEVEHPGGFVSGYFHLANRAGLNVGDPVTTNTSLGQPSNCGAWWGGSTGIHVHLYFNRDPNGISLGGWLIDTSPPPTGASASCSLHRGDQHRCVGHTVRNYGQVPAIRQGLTTTVFAMQTGDTREGGFSLAGGSSGLEVLASHGSDVDIELLSPEGPVQPDLYFKSPTQTVAYLMAADPGDWRFLVTANELEAGGETVEVSVTIDGRWVDTTPPTTTIALSPPSPDGERGWYVSPVAVTLTAEDDLGGSGVAYTEFRLNGGSWQTYSAPFALSEGFTLIEARSTDNVGNVEDPPVSHMVKIDLTLPDISITEGILDGLQWDHVHLERGILTNTDTLALSGNATDNLCLWEVRAVDADSGQTLASQQPDGANTPDWPPPYPPNSLGYGLNVPLHTGINNIDVVAEDCAGWEKAIFIQVVYVIPGPYDPRTKGFWYNAVKTGKYSEADFQTLLDYINVASDTFGPTARNIYGPVTMSNYCGILSPVTSDMEKLQKAQLLATWVNLVSGRAAVLTPANLTPVAGWSQVVDNTGGSPLTFALNVPMEVEEVDQTRTASRAVYQIAKNLLDAFNSRVIIP